MWSWKYRKPRFAGPWRANSTFLTTSHLDKNVELHILIRGGIGLIRRLGAGLPHPECLNECIDDPNGLNSPGLVPVPSQPGGFE